MGLLLLIQLFLTELYYIAVEIFSLSYNSSIYRGLSLLFGIFWILIYFQDIFKKKKISKIEIIMIFFVLILTVLSCFTIIVNNNSNIIALTTFQMFMISAVPSLLGGIYMSKNKLLTNTFKWMDIISLYLNIGIIFTIIHNGSGRLLGRAISFAGVHYQAFSYVAALAFGFTVLSIYYKGFSCGLFRTRFYELVRFVLLFVGLAGVIFGTGRGALVTLASFVVSGGFILYSKIKNKRFLIKVIKYVIVISLVGLILLSYFIEIPQIMYGISKQFRYISIKSGGINWEETSGRTGIYLHSLKLFMDRPLIGYGINSIYFISLTGSYSHNIFLDLLVEGGLIYFLFISIILSYTVYCMRKLVKRDSSLFILKIFFLNSFVMLLFSGSYMRETTLWFVLGYIIYLYNKKRRYNLI